MSQHTFTYVLVTEVILNDVFMYVGCFVEFQRYVRGSIDQPLLETKTACYGLDFLTEDIRDPVTDMPVVTDMSASGQINGQSVRR